MDQKLLDAAAEYPGLGPHYFAARSTAEKFMADFQAEHFEPLIKRAAEELYDKMLTSLHDHLLSDTESNLHSFMWRQIDESVKALLSGERWALEQYALGARYDHEKIRAAVAVHIPTELQDKRIADLEAKVAEQNETIKFLRR